MARRGAGRTGEADSSGSGGGAQGSSTRVQRVQSSNSEATNRGIENTRQWFVNFHMWQSRVENEHYSTVSGLIRLVIRNEITPDFLCPFMND